MSASSFGTTVKARARHLYAQIGSHSCGEAATATNDNGVMGGGPGIDTGGTITDLNTLLPAGSPTIESASGIDDNGQIVATVGVASDGSVLLIPA